MVVKAKHNFRFDEMYRVGGEEFTVSADMYKRIEEFVDVIDKAHSEEPVGEAVPVQPEEPTKADQSKRGRPRKSTTE